MFHRGLLVVIVAGMFSTTQADTIYVDDDAPGGGDGRGWATAYRFLQDALADAAADPGVTAIHVARGTYTPDCSESRPDPPGLDRDATFQLLNGVALIGGYAGLGPGDPGKRDIELYESTLSGDLLGDDTGGPSDPSRNENSYTVVTGSGTDETAVLDGFAVTAGNADGPHGDPNPRICGGGMYNDAGSPTVIGCTFEANIVDSWADYTGGAGMYNRASSPTVIDCTFGGNVADAVADGGGMYNHDSNPAVINCLFDGNSAHFGGAMLNDFYGSPTVIGCTFSGNLAGQDGGGMDNRSFSTPTVTDCLFIANTAHYGGGMRNGYQCNPTVTACTLSGNLVSAFGGGMFNGGGSPLVTSCIFSDNGAGSRGGGMYNNGSSASVVNCVLAGNAAGQSGAAVASVINSHPTLANCTIAGNIAGSGGAVWTTDAYSGHSSTTVVNSIVHGNIGGQIVAADGAVTTVEHSDVQGGFDGTGNIDTDPMCVDPANGDFRLSPGSPCIDTGENTAVPEGVLRDVDGNPRFVDDPCSGLDGAVVDMGACEFQGTSCDLGTVPALPVDPAVASER